MVKKTHIRRFVKDENAISEEFTTLPALSVVMIGFALFIVLIFYTYDAYNTRIDSLEKYQTADFIATKLTNPDCFFIKEGGVINLPVLENKAVSDEKLNSMRSDYEASNINFSVCISWEGVTKYYPEDSLPTDIGDRVAATKDVGIYLNDAQTKPGKLTIITWSE